MERARGSVMAGEGKREEEDLVLVRRGMCKVERLRQVEEVRVLKGVRRDTYTHTQIEAKQFL